MDKQEHWEDEELELITLIDDDGNEESFAVMDMFQHGGNHYLLVVSEQDIDDEESDAFVLKEVAIDETQVTYEMVIDEEELETVYQVLESMGDDDYEVKM